MRISDWSSDVCSSDLAETERALHAFELAEPDAAELGEAEPEIAEPEQDVRLVGVHLGDQPGGGTTGIEELDHRPVILVRPAAILEQSALDLLGDEFHWELPSATGVESLSLA